jgi:hypothetical protein
VEEEPPEDVDYANNIWAQKEERKGAREAKRKRKTFVEEQYATSLRRWMRTATAATI